MCELSLSLTGLYVKCQHEKTLSARIVMDSRLKEILCSFKVHSNDQFSTGEFIGQRRKNRQYWEECTRCSTLKLWQECKELNARPKEAVALWSISRVVVRGGQKSRHLGDRIPMEATTQFEKCKSTNRAKHNQDKNGKV